MIDNAPLTSTQRTFNIVWQLGSNHPESEFDENIILHNSISIGTVFFSFANVDND
jgi:hypothetical protein